MNVVIDSYVIVSGLLTPFGNSAEIMRLFAKGELLLFYDSRILTEYREVLNRPKFDFDKNKIAIILKEIESFAVLVAASPLKKSLPDSGDDMFIEVAIAGQVECLITGNMNHFPDELCGNIRVFSPLAFINSYKEQCL